MHNAIKSSFGDKIRPFLLINQIIVLVCFQNAFVNVVNKIQITTIIDTVSEISRKNVRRKFDAVVYNIYIFALKTFVKDGGI
jgi:hypothetical protein